MFLREWMGLLKSELYSELALPGSVLLFYFLRFCLRVTLKADVINTTCPRQKGATLVFVITFTVVKLFSKFLKLAILHIFCIY